MHCYTSEHLVVHFLLAYSYIRTLVTFQSNSTEFKNMFFERHFGRVSLFRGIFILDGKQTKCSVEAINWPLYFMSRRYVISEEIQFVIEL